MWLTSLLSTGAGVTSVGLGALGTTSYESVRDRRRVRHGAVLLAIGSSLAFSSVVGSGAFTTALLQQLAILEVTALLVSALVVLRFAEEVSAEQVARGQVILTRAARNQREAALLQSLSSLRLDPEPVELGSFPEAQRQAFEKRVAAEPAPKRQPRYQPPVVHDP